MPAQLVRCFMTKCMPVMMVFYPALLRGAPEATRGDPQESLCANKLLFIVEETVAGVEVHNSTAAIRVSFRESVSDSVQQTTVLFNERLPSTCGDHFSRCNMILLTNQTTSTSILLVPVQRGVAAQIFHRVNQTLLLSPTHYVLELPPQIKDCQVTALLDLGEFVDSPMGAFSGIPRVVGLCLNASGGVSVRLVSISVDFSNISKSSISPFVNVVSIRSAAPRVSSNFVFLLDLPQCYEDFFNSLTFYFERSQVGLFDVASEDQVWVEEYTVYHEGTEEEFLCSNPRQLVRISDKVLIVYCNNGSAQVDICRFTSNAVDDVRIHDTKDGIPYYCSNDMTSFVSVRGKTVTYVYNSSFALMNRTLPLMPDEDVYIGNCFQSEDGELESVRFVFTSTLGNTYVVHLRCLERGIREEEAVVLQEGTVNSLSFVPHTVYNNVVVYNNGSTTVLLNSSCLNTISIDHRHHLSLVVSGEGVYPCMCPSCALGPDLRPTEVVSTTLRPTEVVSTTKETKNESNLGVIVGVVVAVIVLLIIILIVVLLVLAWIKRCLARSENRLRHRQLDRSLQSGHTPEAVTQTHSYQVQNGKNDDKNSVVLTHPSQGSSSYKANDIQTLEQISLDSSSEPLSNNNDDSAREHFDYTRRLQCYGIRSNQHLTMTPIEEQNSTCTRDIVPGY